MKLTGPTIFLTLLVSAPVLAQPKPPPAEDAAAGDAAKAEGEAEQDGTDLESLRKEYRELRERLFRSRARASAVASTLYSTKLKVHLDYTAGRAFAVKRAVVRLDGSDVFEDVEGVIARNRAPRFEDHVAPGRHVVNIRVEAVGKKDERFASIIDDTFTVQATADEDLLIRAKVGDGGDITRRWQRKKRGSYALHLDVDVQAIAGANGKKKRKGKKGK